MPSIFSKQKNLNFNFCQYLYELCNSIIIVNFLIMTILSPIVRMLILGVLTIAFDNSVIQHHLRNDIHNPQRKKEKRKRDMESLPHMANTYNNRNLREHEHFPLVIKTTVADLLRDPARNYSKYLTNLYGWELLQLADHLKDKIEANRETYWRQNRRRRRKTNRYRKGKCKHDYVHRLFYCLDWLANGGTMMQFEFKSGWSKSSMNEDIPHILLCIIEGLDDEIKWPDTEERTMLANLNNLVFKNCIGIADIMESPIFKSQNSTHEKETYSGKEGCFAFVI